MPGTTRPGRRSAAWSELGVTEVIVPLGADVDQHAGFDAAIDQGGVGQVAH